MFKQVETGDEPPLWLPEWVTRTEPDLGRRAGFVKVLALGTVLIAACSPEPLPSEAFGYFTNPGPSMLETNKATIPGIEGKISKLNPNEVAILALGYGKTNNLWLQGDVNDPYIEIDYTAPAAGDELYPWLQPIGLRFVEPGDYTAQVVIAGNTGRKRAEEWFKKGSSTNQYPPFNKSKLDQENMRLTNFIATIRYTKD